MTAGERSADPASPTTLDATDRATRAGQGLIARVPWWVWPLAIYAVTRAINAAMIVYASRYAIPPQDLGQIKGSVPFITDAGTPAPGYFTSATNWDGQWYWEIAAHGYPTTLPTDADGNVQQNPWAFYPLYPLIVRLVMAVTGLGFPVAGVLVSLVSGAAACLILLHLVARHTDGQGSIIAVLGLCAFTCSPVFQIAYTEGLALALVVMVVAAVVNRRPWLAAILLVVLAFTRPITLPFAAMFALLAIREWRSTPASVRTIGKYVALALWAGALAFAWPVVAAFTTGRGDAYFKTQKAWNPDAGGPTFVVFVERFSGILGGTSVAALAAVIWAALIVWVVTMKQPVPAMKTWSGLYAAYILAVVDWNPSALRYYLLAIPTFWPLTQSPRSPSDVRGRWVVGLILTIVAMITQWWWIRYCVTISPQVVQVP